MLDSDYRLVDVSCWMDDFQFPGDAPVAVTGPFNFLTGSNPEYVHQLSTPTQAGTHVQGPRYFIADGDTIDRFALADFEGEAVLVDLAKRGEDTTLADLRRALAGRDLAGRILLLRTGHMAEVIESGVLDAGTRPGLSVAAAGWLAEQSGVRMVAIDSVGVESRSTANYEVNVTLCRAGILILEGLVNLAALGGGRLWLEAFPLKLRGVEGTPCRAIVREYPAQL
jgi:arylformamidase